MGRLAVLAGTQGKQRYTGKYLASTNRVAHGILRSRRVEFFLGKEGKERDIVLFGGDQGPEVLEKGCSAPCVLRTCGPAHLFEGLRPILEARGPAALRPAP